MQRIVSVQGSSPFLPKKNRQKINFHSENEPMPWDSVWKSQIGIFSEFTFQPLRILPPPGLASTHKHKTQLLTSVPRRRARSRCARSWTVRYSAHAIAPSRSTTTTRRACAAFSMTLPVITTWTTWHQEHRFYYHVKHHTIVVVQIFLRK